MTSNVDKSRQILDPEARHARSSGPFRFHANVLILSGSRGLCVCLVFSFKPLGTLWKMRSNKADSQFYKRCSGFGLRVVHVKAENVC